MNIVYASNDNYVPFLGISLTSLLVNNQKMPSLNVFVLSDGISINNQNLLRQTADKYQRTISFIDISNFSSSMNFEFDTNGFNMITLSRLFLAQYLPPTIDTVLYLDCDTIIADTLDYLDNIQLDNFHVAAVPELYMPPAKKKQIGHKKYETYYNAGVLLINLKLWRQLNLESVYMDYYKEMNGRLLYNDQDIINHCSKGNIMRLNHRYNLSTNLIYFPRYIIKKIQPAYYCNSSSEYLSILHNPAIIHYMGDERPWIHGNKNAYRKYFYKYRSISEWSNLPDIYGQEWYMVCYHILNLITRIFPWFRILFSNTIGINKYLWFGKN